MITGVTDLLRRARIGDLPTIWLGELAYMREIEPEHEARWAEATDRNLASWIASLDHTMLLEADGEPAGYETWKPKGDAALLTTLHVFDGYRRAGRALVCWAPSSATHVCTASRISPWASTETTQRVDCTRNAASCTPTTKATTATTPGIAHEFLDRAQPVSCDADPLVAPA